MRALSAIAFLGALVNLFNPTSAASDSDGDCLCTSDQPCWPDAATFAQLQSQVSQPLVYPRPTASACYPLSDPTGNCTDVVNNWYNATWRATHPGSMEMPNFETYRFANGTIEACYMNTTITGVCDQGRVPVIGVDARSVTDVQAAIRFAVAHRLKLVVKNTGHDFVGRSTARGAFVVWTHNMKNITYDAAFEPQGAPGDSETSQALTVGAGVQWSEAYLAAYVQGRFIVGGISAGASVGAAGGWLAGGGHSFSSPSYGLGVDNALEISVVLSTGQYLTTNEYQNSDLFWALRGGGGSTYGIVTSVTYRTYPIVPIQIWAYQANVTNSSVLPELVEGFLRFQTQLTDDGWGGYGGISSQGINFNYLALNMTNDTVKATTEGWLNFTQSLVPHGVVFSNQFIPDTWYDILYQLLYGGGADAGAYLIVSSRLLSRDTLANRYAEVAQVLVNCSASFNTIAGGKVNQFAADSAGLNPAWRNAVVETICGASWDETSSSADIRAAIEQLKGWMQELHNLTPNDGAYLNEASPFEIDWQNTFFGSHYSTLKRIKNKYDPYRMFVVKEGVGSDDWNEDLTCRCGS